MELVSLFVLRRNSKLYSNVSRFSPPAGYLLSKQFFNSPNNTCSLLRVTSDNCPFCKKDQPQYRRLVQAAHEHHCQTIVIAPKLGQVKADSSQVGLVQLQFIDMQFGDELIPYITPETILLDRNGVVKWEWEGAMDENALSQATKALPSL